MITILEAIRQLLCLVLDPVAERLNLIYGKPGSRKPRNTWTLPEIERTYTRR